MSEDCRRGSVERTRARWAAALLAIFPVAVAGMTGFASAAGTITIAATDRDMASLTAELVVAFAESTPGGTYQVRYGPEPHTTSYLLISGENERGRIEIRMQPPDRSLEALIGGQSALVLSSARLSPVGGTRLSADSERLIGYDNLAVVVNKANPLADARRGTPFSTARLARILAGEVTDWAELGGQRGPIQLHLPADSTPTQQKISALVMRPNQKQVATGARRHEIEDDVAAAVAADPGALGIVPQVASATVAALPLGLSCGLIYSPVAYSVQTETYPLTSRIYAYTFGQPSEPLAEELIEFLSSTTARETIAGAGYLDVIPRVEEQAESQAWIAGIRAPQEGVPQRGALQVMKKMAEAFNRTTLRVHFAPGRAAIESGSEEEAALIAKVLASDEMRNRKWMLVGFGDPGQSWRPALELGARRAAEVMKSLEGAGLARDQSRVISFGQLGNVGCSTEPAGARLNRRVEVWVDARGN